MEHRIWKKIYKKQEDIVSREIAGETILVPIRGKLVDMQRIFSIDTVAEYIWHQMDGENSLDIICEKVLDTFEVGRKEAQNDILSFVNELADTNLISEVK